MPKLSPWLIGIDPGQAGGLCRIVDGTDWVVVDPMPATETDVWNWLRDLNDVGRGVSRPVYAAIERVHAMPEQGVASTFKFGMGYGFLRGCLVAAGIPFVEVAPRDWVKELGVPGRKKSESKRVWKDRLRATAQRLYPRLEAWNENLTYQRSVCDALLIAEYLRRTHK